MSTLSTTAAAAATGKPSWGRLVGWGLFLAILAWSWKGAEMNPAVLFRDAGNMATFAADFFPPDFGNWKLYLSEMLVTVQIALWGTVLAIVCAIPLSILASENIVPWWVYQPVRRVMDACRSINEMVFAMLFVVAVGLGPFAGVLALFISTTGVLAKLFAEAVEAIDPGPVEGVRATGASALQEVIFGVIPQVLPLWISYSLYRFESNVRSATVVGMVGAGGIGVILWEAIRGFQFGQTCAVLIVIIVVVSLIDVLSQRLRKLFILRREEGAWCALSKPCTCLDKANRCTANWPNGCARNCWPTAPATTCPARSNWPSASR